MSSTKFGSYFHFVYVLLVLILLLKPLTTTAAASTVTSSSTASIRKPLLNPSRTKVDCSQIGLRSECTLNSRCKWCRSESIDDMCFSKSEAWRLPSQVFICD